ncbi:MAG TPA: GAF domain-containing protein [Baekduia sp.]
MPLLALIVILGVGGFVLTSTTIRRDRDRAAQRRAEVQAVQAQEVLGRARAYVAGLAVVLAQEAPPGQARFARWAQATSASVGLNDVLWVQSVPASGRARYERRRGVPITRLTPSGRVVRAPPARSYLPATFTSETRPELRPGVDLTSVPALAAAIRDPTRIFAVGASRPSALGGDPGFFLLQAASFSHGPGSRGYLVAFVPQGWFSTTLAGDTRNVAITADGRPIEGRLGATRASAGFEMLGRHWRIDVSRDPLSGLQSLLPWMALIWPFAVAAIVFAIGRAITLRRRAQREVERIFELSLDVMCVTDLDGRLKAVNPAFEQTLGYPRAEALSEPFLRFVHPDDQERTRAVFEGVVAGHPVDQFENRCLCADGSVRWLQWTGRAEPRQRVVYVTARDVTERRRIDAELRDAKLTAETRGGELQVLAGEQAALRRVATLVARDAAPEEVFAAVANEVERLLSVGMANVGRYESDGTVTFVATAGDVLPVGSRWPLGDKTNLATLVLETGRPARLDDYAEATGALAEGMRDAGIRSAVGTPIVVEGRLWGLMAAGSRRAQALPPDTEARLASFTELVAVAIAKTEARTEVRRLADEQAALRRVATLVARESPPAQVFAAVAQEVSRVLHVDDAGVFRYEDGVAVTVLANANERDPPVPTGDCRALDGDDVAGRVQRTGRPARIEGSADHDGAGAGAGAPIVVGGRLWGVIVARSPQPRLPADTEERIGQFTELVATAISNIQARSELAASRGRIVAATDEERRRVVRDLHDGAQQRLVSTIVTLKLADRALHAGEPEQLAALLGEALDNAEQANVELRELAHGILPEVLTQGGLRAGVDSLASRMPVPVRNDVAVGRLPAAVEATAYFVIAEALTNVAKHAHARHATVNAHVADGTVHLQVRDDGIGGVRPDGSGLLGLADRLAAHDGRLRVESPAAGGTVVAADIPLTG